MIVVDASVLTNAFTDDGPIGDATRAELARDLHWARPEQLLAESFDCALVTADVRIARRPGLRCEVRVALPATG